MPRKTTPSFITELPMIVDSACEKELNAKFNAGFRLLNAVQSEAVIRMNLLRNSEAWNEAKKLLKTIKDSKGKVISNPERSKAFEEAKKAYRFTEHDLQSIAPL